MAADAEVGTEAPGKKGLSKLFVIGGGAAIVVLLAGAGLFFALSSSATDASADGQGAATTIPSDTFIFNLPPMMVNLNSEGGTQSNMKLTIALEVANEAMMNEIQPRLPKVIDAFQVYMRELRKSDLEGSAGIYRLKEELLRRVNMAIYPAHVQSVLFKEILVQ
ncbi:flagellar basal body-associated FliL family protein [Devosia sp. YIM 151766]|uniref:flagellar basal body-associated FliL family protein n=1 Tax=Devosia sp. YIM 151766 TaxID=3017325 RepID=UPI00255CABA0|nr:flagellar basal body-associated FliL family protein [Devosia sp. YIM 151766]WIY51638.1 flagellar basal body-associated FliL family protein [Devosia sp. YIM 151766]